MFMACFGNIVTSKTKENETVSDKIVSLKFN